MKKTANEIADAVLLKVAVSEQLASKVLRGSPKLKELTSTQNVGDIFDFFTRKYLRTNLRSQGVPREGMLAAKEQLKFSAEGLPEEEGITWGRSSVPSQSAIGAGIGSALGGGWGAISHLTPSGVRNSTISALPKGALAKKLISSMGRIGAPLGVGALLGGSLGAIKGKYVDDPITKTLSEREVEPSHMGPTGGALRGAAAGAITPAVIAAALALKHGIKPSASNLKGLMPYVLGGAHAGAVGGGVAGMINKTNPYTPE